MHTDIGAAAQYKNNQAFENHAIQSIKKAEFLPWLCKKQTLFLFYAGRWSAG